MGSSLPRAVCIQEDLGQEELGGKCRPGWVVLHPLTRSAGSPHGAGAAGRLAWHWAMAPMCHGRERAPFGDTS